MVNYDIYYKQSVANLIKPLPMSINSDTRVVLTSELPIFTTLDSQTMMVKSIGRCYENYHCTGVYNICHNGFPVQAKSPFCINDDVKMQKRHSDVFARRRCFCTVVFN